VDSNAGEEESCQEEGEEEGEEEVVPGNLPHHRWGAPGDQIPRRHSPDIRFRIVRSGSTYCASILERKEGDHYHASQEESQEESEEEITVFHRSGVIGCTMNNTTRQSSWYCFFRDAQAVLACLPPASLSSLPHGQT
jgi:hypothetical protein